MKRGRLVLYCVVGIGTVMIGSYVAAVLYMKYQGAGLIDYCNEALIGKSTAQMMAEAREARFEIVEGDEMIILTMPGRRHGRTCVLSTSNGMVSEFKSAFTH